MSIDLQEFSRTLFAAANQLWTNTALRPDQYAQPVLALIALRQMEAKFEAVHAELAPQYKGRLKPAPADYQAKGAIFLPENARFSRLLALPGTADLGAELNAAMKGIADANPDLAGALPQGYQGLPNTVLQELLRLLAPLQIEGDAYGLIFEYFMGQFASQFMQKGGEYFTPASVVKLIVEIIEPITARSSIRRVGLVACLFTQPSSCGVTTSRRPTRSASTAWRRCRTLCASAG
jgi:type I restriction enzyme M protein